jgi:hypothetical protein
VKHIKRELHRAMRERAILLPSVVDGESLSKPKWSARFRSQTGYWVLFKDGVYWETTGTKDEEEARQLLDVLQLQEDAREDNIVDCRRASVEEAIEHRIEAVNKLKKVSAPQIESTLNAFKPYVEGKQLRQLDEAWLDETEEAMLADGHSYSYFWNAINYYRTANRKYCAASFSLPVLPFAMPPRAESRKRVVSNEEQADIVRLSTGNEAYDKSTKIWTPRNCISAAEAHRRLITYRETYMGATFGSRAGVYVGLSYGPRQDGGGFIDFENAVFHRVKPGTKTAPNKRSPPVDMSPRQVDEIDGWQFKDDGCPWLFPNQGRSGFLGQERMRVIYDDAMEELGIEDVFAHTWRHTLISRLILKRQSAYAIAAVAGVSVEMINRVYAHYDMGAVQRLAHDAMDSMTAPRKAA